MNSKLTILAHFHPCMQRAKQCLFVLLLCSSFFSYAQRPYYNQRPEYLKANSVWAFGSFAGLDFNSGGPVPIRTAIRTMEGCASVADPASGKLLFYSNGGQVWNANHQMMPNGDSLMGNASIVGKSEYSNYSTRQGVCIVPVIGDPARYYLFSLSGFSSGGPKPLGTLFYNIIDMGLDNGRGDIVPGQKNIALDRDYLTESVTAVPGDNCDIWLIVHAGVEKEFKSYHITQNGIDTIPVISRTNKDILYYNLGGMAISPDRSKIVVTASNVPRSATSAGALIAEFDPATGNITNDILCVPKYSMKDLCFSPDNSKLYLNAGALSGSGLPSGIVQLDLTVFDSAAIGNSAVIVQQSSGIASPFKLYNDTIYFLASGGGYAGSGYEMGRINQPNLSGSACDFQGTAIMLSTSYSDSLRLHESLNSDVVLPLPPDTIHTLALDTLVCPPNLTLSAPQEWEGYTWEDGSTSMIRNITASGTYWVRSGNYCHYRVDSFEVSFIDMTPPVINVDERTLGTTTPYHSYQWMLGGHIIPGATERTYTVPENGDYQVIVTHEMGCTDTSEVYRVTNANLIKDRVSLREQIHIYPNPVTRTNSRLYIDAPFAVNIKLTDLAGKLVKKEANTKVMTVGELPSGIYLLHISDKEGVLLKTEKLVRAE